MKILLSVLIAGFCSLPSYSAPNPRSKEETRLVKKFPKVFARSGNTLTFQLEGKDKAPRVFTDNPTEGEQYGEHHLFSYHPAHHVAVIQRYFYEGGDYILLSLKTGLETTILDKPHWNKAGDLFASVTQGEQAEDKNGLQLGHCDGKECKLLTEKDGRYSKPKWISATRFQAVNRIPSADGGEGLVLRVRCSVNRKTLKASCVP